MRPAGISRQVPSPLLKHEEAAEYLQVSPRTLTNLVASRQVGFVKIGRCRRYLIVELDRFIESRWQKSVGWKANQRANSTDATTKRSSMDYAS